MSLSNAGIVTAPSSIAATGGTALNFSSVGSPSKGKVSLIVTADTDLRLRRTIDVSASAPTVNAGAPNGYSQARVQFLFRKPKLLANGKITVNTVSVNFGYDVETTQAEIQELLDVASQMCFDADFTPTVKSLSIS